MKIKIKKVLTGICLAVALLLCGIPAPKVSAVYDTCLDVRDYGYHRYTMRTYVYNQGVISKNLQRKVVISDGRHAYEIREYMVTRLWMRLSICICGLGRTEYYTTVEYVTETEEIR